MERRKCIISTICKDKRIWRCMCILVLYLILVDALLNESEPMIHTKWGIIRGKWSRSVRDQRIANFLGIPYALPPVGDLRFKSPQRWNQAWNTIRNATTDGEQCLQMSNSEIVGSEDCLYLNIFIPYIPGIQKMNLPVLVFIHGGGFSSGSSNSTEYAPDYLLDKNVILVTFNYRLNIFGFFSTTNQVSPGNYGLKDMKMALEWIHENIHSFHGNPESVTLMGGSAGAGSTHLLALSNKTEGLFHKYILLSGSGLASWAYRPREAYRQTCLKLARLVGCEPKKSDGKIASNGIVAENFEKENRETRSNANVNVSHKNNNERYITEDEEMVKCMRSIDARQLMKMLKHFEVWRKNPLCSFAPTLEDDSEDAILTMQPSKIIEKGLFRDIPAIMQVAKDEGLVKTHGFFVDPEMKDEMIKNFEKYLPYLMENYDWISNTSIFTAAIQDFYFNGNMSNFKERITKAVSDGAIIWPTYKAAQYQSKLGNSSIYVSLFSYEGTFSFTFSAGFPINNGVSHNDDLNYLFPILNNKFSNMMLNNTETDFLVINTMTEMWTNFMREGVPKAWMIPTWPDYRDHHQFMRYGIGKSPDIVVETDFLSERMKFWEKLSVNVLVEPAERDTITNSSPNNMFPGNADTIDYKFTIYLILLIISLLCLYY